MKKFLFVGFFCICATNSLFAADTGENNVFARRAADEIYNLFLRTDCRATDDDFVRRACKLNDKTTKSLILWHIAEYKMQEYLNNLIADMDKISARTGRSVRYAEYDDGYGNISQEWWLDRGELDDVKCNWDFAARQACFYPDDFMEYKISFSDTNSENDITMQKISVQIDNPDANTTNFMDVFLYASYYDDDNNKVYVIIGGNEYKYDDFYKWQNQTAQDVKNGMFVKVSRKEKRRQAKQLKNSPFRPIEWMMDEGKEWASQKLPKVIMFERAIDAETISLKVGI